MEDQPRHLFTPLSAVLDFHRSPSILLSLHFYPSVRPHLITTALVNKCITHELIHGSFNSAPYGPTVKPQQLFKVFAYLCFLY